MSNPGIKLNPREQRELALSKIVLGFLAVVGLGVAVWFAWFSPLKHESKSIGSYAACIAAGNEVQQSYPSVCVTKEGKRFANPKEKVQLPSGDMPQKVQPVHLTISEWNLQLPLTDQTSDLVYAYVATDSGERVSFTFKRLQDINICKTDVGVSLTRTMVQNKTPYSLENPEPVAHVGDYYYYVAYGGSPCYDASNGEQMKVVKTINNGDLLAAVKQVLPKLEAAS